MSTLPLTTRSTTLPELPAVYLRALLLRLPFATDVIGLKHASLSSATSTVLGTNTLPAYAELCAAELQPPNIPPAYPQVRTNGMQGTLMLESGRGGGSLSLVHVRNTIDVYDDFSLDDVMDIECKLGAIMPVKRGKEHELGTTLRRNGKLLWRSSAIFLLRGEKSSRKRQSKQQKSDDGPFSERTLGKETCRQTWNLGPDLGRRYARISGDYNPIHLGRLPARLFGFQKPIAHGLWMLEFAFSAFKQQHPHMKTPFRYEAAFLRPVFLPSTPTLRLHEHGFVLWDDTRERPLFLGHVGDIPE